MRCPFVVILYLPYHRPSSSVSVSAPAPPRSLIIHTPPTPTTSPSSFFLLPYSPSHCCPSPAPPPRHGQLNPNTASRTFDRPWHPPDGPFCEYHDPNVVVVGKFLTHNTQFYRFLSLYISLSIYLSLYISLSLYLYIYIFILKIPHYLVYSSIRNLTALSALPIRSEERCDSN